MTPKACLRVGAISRCSAAAAVVLFANFVVMSVELLATRLLFPRFGDTIFTWSAVVSIIIGGLSLGYAAGGYLAERRQRALLISEELALSAALIAAVPWLYNRLLPAPAGPDASFCPPLLGGFLVFGLPAACLAAIPPAAVGVLTDEGVGAAWASGIVSAHAAVGSILGILGTTFWLVPRFAVSSLFLAYGFGLALLSIAAGLIRDRRVSWRTFAAGLILAGPAGLLRAGGRPAEALEDRALGAAPIFWLQSRQQLIRVFERDGTRFLMLGSTHQSAMRLSDQAIVYDYQRAYRMFPNVFGTRGRPTLAFIGGGAFAMPLRTARELPGARIDVVESDGAVFETALRFFGAGRAPNVKTIVADGRQVMRGANARYDGVFVDVFRDRAVPFEFLTREFFEELSRGLKPNGIAGLNVGATRLSDENDFACSVVRTIGSVFPRVDIYPIDGRFGAARGLIFIASKRADGRSSRDLLRGAGFGPPMDARRLPCGPRTPLLTDDFAPVEWMTARQFAPRS